MQMTAEILGKQIQIECTDAAEKALSVLDTPLQVEMELYFSCLIRKAVRFNAASRPPFSVQVSPRLTLGFRPVATRACSAEDFKIAPPVDDFPIVKPEAFVPKSLFIDFRRGQWVGEFQMA